MTDSSKQNGERRFRSVMEVKSTYLPALSESYDRGDGLVDRAAELTQIALKKHVKRSDLRHASK